MPARLIAYYKNDSEFKEQTILKIIKNQKSDKLFVVSVKSSIRASDEERLKGTKIYNKILFGSDADEYYQNKTINFAPIFRNININTNTDKLGKLTYNRLRDSKTCKSVRKLVQLMYTNGEFMSFSTYYLWFLIDSCHFQIDDVDELALFARTNCFEKWYEKMMNKRMEYMLQKNSGGE
jgi:hypothetical protein